MAWEDKPSDAQLNAWYNFTKWIIAREEGSRATKYLENNVTRRDLSNELGRLRNLSINRKLKTREQVYNSRIWENYEHE